jgi:ethanolamine utilization cobalamin adenosyltransferase
MANVITQVEIMKYSGMDKAIFPLGTIITPSAKDWAHENNIRIVIGECQSENVETSQVSINNTEKDILLQQVIKSVVENMDKVGGFLSKYELTSTVTKCLQKLGCHIKN